MVALSIRARAMAGGGQSRNMLCVEWFYGEEHDDFEGFVVVVAQITIGPPPVCILPPASPREAAAAEQNAE